MSLIIQQVFDPLEDGRHEMVRNGQNVLDLFWQCRIFKCIANVEKDNNLNTLSDKVQPTYCTVLFCYFFLSFLCCMYAALY